MAIGISWNMDIGQSLNSRDSFPGRKFKNRAPTSCSPGPILWPPTISFEHHAEMAEEIDLEKCTFRNFGSSVTLTLTLDRVEVTLVRICGRGLPTHRIRWKSEKVFVDVRTDGRTHLSSNLLGHRRGDDLKTEFMCAAFVYRCLISVIVSHVCIPCNFFLPFGKQNSGKPAGVFYILPTGVFYIFAYCFLIISRGLLTFGHS